MKFKYELTSEENISWMKRAMIKPNKIAFSGVLSYLQLKRYSLFDPNLLRTQK